MGSSRKPVEGSQPNCGIKLEKDVYVKVRDGVRLCLDVFRPDAEGQFPALLAYGQYGKEVEEMGLTFPPQARPSPLFGDLIIPTHAWCPSLREKFLNMR